MAPISATDAVTHNLYYVQLACLLGAISRANASWHEKAPLTFISEARKYSPPLLAMLVLQNRSYLFARHLWHAVLQSRL